MKTNCFIKTKWEILKDHFNLFQFKIHFNRFNKIYFIRYSNLDIWIKNERIGKHEHIYLDMWINIDEIIIINDLGKVVRYTSIVDHWLNLFY